MKLRSVFVAVASLMGMTSAAHASVVADFELNGSLASSVGSATLIAQGGSLGASHYNVSTPNAGLALDTAGLISNVYTIDIGFSFNTLGGWQKIIDFQNLATDAGLYTLGNAIDLYPVNNGGSLTAGTQVDVQMTRNAAGLVAVFLNGTQLFTYSDTSSIFIPSNRLNFFIDDLVTGQNEAAAASVDYIRISNDALPIAGSVSGAVPEPSSWVLMLLGFGMAGAALRRRARVSYNFG